MNIKLTLDDELVRKVRKIAVERGTTLANMIRDHWRNSPPGALYPAGGAGIAQPWSVASSGSNSRSASEPGSVQTSMPAAEFLTRVICANSASRKT